MAYKIGRDKKKHFYVGIPLGMLLQLLSFWFFPLQHILSTATCFLFLAAICYGFELFSLVSRKGHADNLDAIAGIIGGIIGMAVFWGIQHLL